MNISLKQTLENQLYNIYQDIIKQIMATDNSSYFFRPVDPEADCALDYYQVIVDPMCFFTVQSKVDKREYPRPEDFVKDVNQIFINAKQYNNNNHPIYKTAEIMANKFLHLSARLPRSMTEFEINNGLQIDVELRLLRYKLYKGSHL